MAKWLETIRRAGTRAGTRTLRSAESAEPAFDTTILELMVSEGVDAGQQFTVDGTRVTIGRGKPMPGQTGTILLHDTTVSAEQATIYVDDAGATLVHNPSATNPTLLNGHRVRREKIAPGDEIRMGRVLIEVRERSGIGLSGLASSTSSSTSAYPVTDPVTFSGDPDATMMEATEADPSAARSAARDFSADETQVRVTVSPPELARGRLTLTRGVPELANKSFPLRSSQTIIGRSLDCDVSIPEPGISRQHCRIEWEAGDPVVVHLSQTNGTTVNGAPVTDRLRVSDGDEIRLADQVVLRVDLGATDAVADALETTIPPTSRNRSLQAIMEEKIERDRLIEEQFSVEGSFLDIDVVGSYQMKTLTKRPAHIIVSFERFRAFVGSVIEEFDGQVLNSNGDELMCFFESTLQSVRAASAILERLDEFNENENVLETPFRFRIGVHTGTSLVDRARGVAYSPVLDVAGHLQKDAEVNSLLISEATYAALPPGLPFDPAGKLEDGGMPVYRLTGPL